MRRFFAVCLALGLVLVAQVALSHQSWLTKPKEVPIARMASRTALPPPDSDTVEVNGVRFEILVPQRVWAIPENKPNTSTKLLIGLRIINFTRTPYRFSRYFSIIPEFVREDDQPLQRSGGSDSVLPPRECDFPIVLPGQDTSFVLHGRLRWQRNRLQVSFYDGFNGVLAFNDLKPGRYQLRFLYGNSSPTAEVYGLGNVFGETVEGFWIGKAETPFVELQLVVPNSQ